MGALDRLALIRGKRHTTRDVTLRMRAVYLLVLALGALLSVLIFSFGEDVINASRKLVRQDLPLLEDLSLLKVQVMEQETILYEYFATGERTRFFEEYAANERDGDFAFARVARGFGNSEEINRIQSYRLRLSGLAEELDQTLRRRDIDTEHAQAVLAHLSSLVRALNAELDQLTQLIEARVVESSRFTEVSVNRIGRLVLLYTMGIFLVAMFVGYYVNAYLRSDAERRRLAVFPERNPNPVLRLSLAGEVIYANPAATELLRTVGADENNTRGLLPRDLPQRLRTLRVSSSGYEIWQYDISGRSLECGIHYLPDLGIFHAYVSDVTDRRRTEERLAFLAYHNAVTGLPNRRMFEEVAARMLWPPEQGGSEAAVFILGIDRFGVVIETFGHAFGDELLRAVAARLKAIVEQCRDVCGNATLYHFDSELFAILVPALSGSQAAALIAERMMQSMKQPLYVAGREFFVSFSIGVAIFPHDGRDPITLMRNAESAMLRVRRHGGHGFRLYKPEMNAMAAQWLALENYLRHALEHHELAVYYQPQVDLRNGRVSGIEALLRWNHPTRGVLAPGEFIQLAEDTGMIVEIGEWVLRQACAQQRAWREQGLVHGPVAVNMSAGQFHQQSLTELVAKVLTASGLAAHDLELEITETVAMQDVERSTATLRELKAMQVQLAIDDFGTGFSSLSYLKRFPIDKLKVDRSFIHNITTDGNDAAITRAVITLGHALKQRVVAEGVETPEQLARLRQYECDEAQGYLYSQPLSAADLERWLKSRLHGRADLAVQ